MDSNSYSLIFVCSNNSFYGTWQSFAGPHGPCKREIHYGGLHLQNSSMALSKPAILAIFWRECRILPSLSLYSQLFRKGRHVKRYMPPCLKLCTIYFDTRQNTICLPWFVSFQGILCQSVLGHVYVMFFTYLLKPMNWIAWLKTFYSLRHGHGLAT